MLVECCAPNSFMLMLGREMQSRIQMVEASQRLVMQRAYTQTQQDKHLQERQQEQRINHSRITDFSIDAIMGNNIGNPPIGLSTGDNRAIDLRCTSGKSIVCEPTGDEIDVVNLDGCSCSANHEADKHGDEVDANLIQCLFNLNDKINEQVVDYRNSNSGSGSGSGSDSNSNSNPVESDANAKRPRPKKYQCPYCWVALSNTGQFRGHIRIHTGERPFKCDHAYCQKTFTRNEELTRHKRIHTGQRPYGCPLCNKRFGRKDHLKKHTRTHEKHLANTAKQLSPVCLQTDR